MTAGTAARIDLDGLHTLERARAWARMKQPPGPAWVWPLVGAIVAAALIVARAPTQLLHPYIWAEGGTQFFANVYNLQLHRALFLPQAGDLGTFTTLGAWVTSHFPIRDVPALMAIISLIGQVLPVALLLSPRAQPIASSFAVRCLLALMIVFSYTGQDLDFTLVNTQWWLALAGLITLLSRPAIRWTSRACDAVVLILTGLTGPFAFPLGLVAWVQYAGRRRAGSTPRPLWPSIVLTACAAVQAVSILIISPHYRGNPTVETFTPPHLGATVPLFFKLVGGRILLGSVIGEVHGLNAPLAAQVVAFCVGVGVLVYVVRAWPAPLMGFLTLAGFIAAGGLLLPTAASPAWPALATTGGDVYFFMAQTAVRLTLLWLVLRRQVPIPIRWGAGLVFLISMYVAVVAHWGISIAPRTAGFDAAAAALERATPGTVVTFPIEPAGWVMKLRKP